jgi:hypothetical protein
MPRRQSVDQKLTDLEVAVEAADAGALRGLLDRALTDKQCRVVALAARVAADRLVYDCLPSLLAAYPRFIENPSRRDPGCIAKKAILRAAYELDCDDASFYLTALCYRQPEPVWGGTVDTATDLRCTAAMGLVASGYPRALLEVTELLLDSEAPARAGAARAIACGNPREAELLLRFKAQVGDEDALVLADCFAGLLAVEPDESVGFVARYLESEDDAVCEAAALALGESRLPAALGSLEAAANAAYVPDWFRRVLVRAAALHRSDAAFAWLLRLAGEAPLKTAAHVIEILAIYRHNTRLGRDLARIIEERSEPELQTLFSEHWEL